MLDHYATLGLARAPWINPELLKESFLRLSAELHPDKAPADKENAEARFRAVNEAHAVLRNSRSRILHLLELDGEASPSRVENIPPAALEFFSAIAEITKKTEALLKEKAAAHSPMLKVQFFDKALDGVESLQQLQQRVQARIGEVEAAIQQIGTEWDKSANRDRLKAQLQSAAAALGFLERWNAQLQEKATALTF